MTKKLYSSLSFLLAAMGSGAQDSTRSLQFSGGVDFYTRYNFANALNNFTSFTQSQNSFELGMATIRADASAMSGKVTATLDLGFGRRAEEFSYNDGDQGANKNGYISLSNVKQLYLTYSPSAALKFTFGKFTTHVGYELLDAQLNRNYSMSYMFTNGPFFHTGVKADYTAGGLGFMVGLTNYTDQSTSTNNVKSLIAQVSGGTRNGKIKAFLNYVGSYGSKTLSIPGGLEALTQVDLVVTGTVNSHFGLGVNATLQNRKGLANGSWWGSALYLNYDPTEKTGLTLRSEYIRDSNRVTFLSEHIFAHTLSLNYRVGPLTFIPELRFETARAPMFVKSDGSATRSAFTALGAVVYKF